MSTQQINPSTQINPSYTVPSASLPTPSATTLGGVMANTGPTGYIVAGINPANGQLIFVSGPTGGGGGGGTGPTGPTGPVGPTGYTGYTGPAGGGGGGGALTLLASVTTSGSQATVAFNSISQAYTDLILVVRGAASSSNPTSVYIAFNGDNSNNNYDYEDVHWYYNAIAGPSQSLAQNTAYIGYLAGGSGTVYATNTKVEIFGYAGTAMNKSYSSDYGGTLGTGNYDVGGGETDGGWRSAAAITSIVVSLSGGNFNDGSLVSLYGRL